KHDPQFVEGINEFTKRISNYFPITWKIIPPPKNGGLLSGDELKKREAEAILKGLEATDYLVCLDERGKMLSSVRLAELIQARANGSTRQLIFLIGGAFGIDPTVLKRANFSWSLSELTFPHQLVRLILAEQVYRSCTILRNE